MLGTWVEDPQGLEGTPGQSRGLGLLPIKTVLKAPKTTTLSEFEWDGTPGRGYEIHMGFTHRFSGSPFLSISSRNTVPCDETDGCISEDKRVTGTYIHGFFDAPAISSKWLALIGLTDLTAEGKNMGEQKVKNIAEPVKAYRIRGIGPGITTAKSKRYAQSMSADKPSIVVLPFENMSKDAENDFFVDGVTEEIMTCLCRFREIVVAALGSSILVAKQTMDVGEATRRLGVRFALSGSVRRAGDRAKITARLIEGETGHQIWSEHYDRVIDDIFQVQDEVAQKIVTMLVGNIERTDHERSLHKETDNLSAYECVLRGRQLFGDWYGTKDSVLRAGEMFERAIELDPRYAAAYAGLAATHGEKFKYGWTSTPEISGNLSIELAQKAIDLDERDSYAHLVLSNAYWRVKSNFGLARSQLETAIELNPNYYWNYCYGCNFSVCAGELDISVDHANEAIRRNPLLPDGCLWTLGFTEYLARRYDNAITTVGRMTTLESANFACLAACYGQLGLDVEARAAAEEFGKTAKKSNMNSADWRKYWRRLFNFKDQTSIEHLIEGLDKAGLVAR